ncbi:polysaccharide deacetylase family protein [Roseomonas sp. HJA6]|uniref:Chitooligosaccharide deacetylase n=1 Tax=Roseomonas alba TaxID=2846776 RepID=A0ABS7A2I8_9PROT|nr:polysaccharide deacetylase family protein [Neoroseomonas alba]MBW6396490.1 polysaccharide deacetylase family protein [Neoroseomonas alba]
MLKELLIRVGFAHIALPILGGRGAVLVFHRLGPPQADLIFEANQRNIVSASTFGLLLDALAEDGVDVVTLDEAQQRLADPRARRFVCLTFDDGYRDNHDLLLPILEARRVPATVYVAPGLVDGTSPLWWYALDEAIAREPRLRLPLPAETTIATGDRTGKQRAFATTAHVMTTAPADVRAGLMTALIERYGVDPKVLAARHMMDWTMIRRLAASPMIEIGAHTLSHPPLATLTEHAAAEEMAGSRERLEHETARAVRHLAFPYGSPGTTGAREAQIAAALGFRTAVTTVRGNLDRRHAEARHAWPRHGMGPADGPSALRLRLAGISNPFHIVRPDR